MCVMNEEIDAWLEAGGKTTSANKRHSGRAGMSLMFVCAYFWGGGGAPTLTSPNFTDATKGGLSAVRFQHVFDWRKFNPSFAADYRTADSSVYRPCPACQAL